MFEVSVLVSGFVVRCSHWYLLVIKEGSGG